MAHRTLHYLAQAGAGPVFSQEAQACLARAGYVLSELNANYCFSQLQPGEAIVIVSHDLLQTVQTLSLSGTRFRSFLFASTVAENDATRLIDWLNKSSTEPELRLRVQIESSADAVDSQANMIHELLKTRVGPLELRQIVLVVQESLRNALEHGNCGISSSEKQSAILAETFDSLVRERSKAARSAGKRILLESRLTATWVEFEIEDQGEGFDWRKLLSELDVSKVAETVSGRGLLIAQLLFDEISYNEKGNRLRLAKRLS